MFESIDELWRLFTAGAPPVKMLLRQVGTEGENKLRDALASVVEVEFDRGPISTLNTATVGCGVAP